MKKKTGESSALRARVERALTLNRQARLNFPGIFMRVAGREVGEDGLTLEVGDDPTLQDARGDLNWLAFGVVVDIALGAVTRMKAGPTVRPATVQLIVQMTGASMSGRLATHAHFIGYSERTSVRQALSTALIKSGDTLIGHASGAFVLLDLPHGTTQEQLPWLPEEMAQAPLAPVSLDASEREAVKACARAEAAASEAHPFIDHFWCGIPKARAGGAELNVKVTPHLGNRVGHVHGGVLLGMAARVASAALPKRMMISNLCSWFVSPGQGPRLKVRSKVVQQGRNLAIVHTRIVSATGKLVLEVTSQHIGRGSAS